MSPSQSITISRRQSRRHESILIQLQYCRFEWGKYIRRGYRQRISRRRLSQQCYLGRSEVADKKRGRITYSIIVRHHRGQSAKVPPMPSSPYSLGPTSIRYSLTLLFALGTMWGGITVLAKVVGDDGVPALGYAFWQTSGHLSPICSLLSSALKALTGGGPAVLFLVLPERSSCYFRKAAFQTEK